MLTPKERLIKALRCEKIDRVPCICPGGMMNMIVGDIMDISSVKWPEAHINCNMMAKLTLSMYENGGFENCGVPFCMTVEAEAMGAEVYMGTKYNEPRVVRYPIENITEWRTLKSIDTELGRVKVVLDAIKILTNENEGVPVIGNLIGPISLASSLIEPMYYYKDLRKHPKESHEFMEFVTENLIEFGKAQIDAGAQVIAISDPSGTGEILGPKLFREYAIPYLNKIVQDLKAYKDVEVIIHICGRLQSIYKELNELKSNAISFDSITNVKQVVENVEGKAIMGNISTLALENSDENVVFSMARKCIEDGVNILSPACGIGTKTKLKNIQSIVEATKE